MARPALLVSTAAIFLQLHVTTADGFVGCLFSKALCQDEVEWCFDDYAFGRCLPHYGDEEDGDLYRFDLQRDTLHDLERQMERLFKLGYRWSHLYTQCVLQTLLHAVRYQAEYDDSTCSMLSDQDLNAALKVLEGEVEQHLDPQRVAQVQFTPSIDNPHPEYADEIYVPLLEKNAENLAENQPEDNVDSLSPFLSQLSYYDKPKRSRNQRRLRDDYRITPDDIKYLERLADEEEQLSRILPVEEPRPQTHFTERYNTPDNFRQGVESKDYIEEEVLPIPKSFSRNYNTPDNFRQGIETKDGEFVRNPASYLERSFHASPQSRELVYDNFRNDNEEESDLRDLAAVFGSDRKAADNVEGVYTEGGLVYLKESGRDEESSEPTIDDLVDSYGPMGWGFKRPERLDVKKPGPEFNTNNFAFKQEKDGKEAKTEQGAAGLALEPGTKGNSATKNEIPKARLVQKPEKKKVGSPMESPSLKKPPLQDVDSGEQADSYTYLQFKNKIISWEEGARIVRAVAKFLNLDPNTFSHTRVDDTQVMFKVEPNRLALNASEVAKRIDGLKEALRADLGLEVTATGIGDKDKLKLPSVTSLSPEDEHQLWVVSFLLCGLIAAVAIAGAALFVIKRHAHTRDKLQGLGQPDTEASKDYQDLCRARMATKSVSEKPEGSIMGQRINNLTRESEGSNQSPSSRSSTSSWSEEPALTNMDISTGHMVLSYMEDHLKNKDRLEQEWVALGAYEAEPCATTIAQKPEHSKKNRYNEVLPYDHARVVLNELANITGSDYINASTITDHDPRNPAYIATQGPLPQTAPDLWQMVWEQGSVVMVMLTRLTENGSAMCHRYWPEEGSELYHIYEVHLVSEHVWCDDYLVRSFYLKNLKTGETRTVTQFHFLSWPENGVPLSTKALLEFRRKVNKSYRGRSCPIVVHCSDGVGRTGTYCLIDMVLNRMAKGAKEIDIAATLEHIRDQRPIMVRTKQQFEFVLMAVAEEVHAILKALPANHSPPPVLKEKE